MIDIMTLGDCVMRHFRRGIEFKKIRNRLAVILGTFVLLIIVLLGWVHFVSVKRALLKDIREKQLLTNLVAAQSSLQARMLKAIETSELLAEDPALMAWFVGSGQDEQARLLGLQQLDRLKKNYNYAAVFAINNRSLNYWQQEYELLDIVSKDDPDDSWYFDALEKGIKTSLNFDFNRELNQSMLFVNVIMGDVSDPIGVAGVGIDPSLFIDDFKAQRLSPNSDLWLIDEEGSIDMAEQVDQINQSFGDVTSPQLMQLILKNKHQKIIPNQVINGRKVEVACMQLGDTSYKVVMLVPIDELLGLLNVIRFNTFWVSVLVLAVTLLLVTVVARQITTPLSRLTQLSGSFAGGNLNVSIAPGLIGRQDEIGQLATAFEAMKQQLADFIERVKDTNQALEKEKEYLNNSNEELETALERAAESDRLTKSFLANISHEIRTPMNSILGFAQLLEIQDLDQSERNEYARYVIKSGQQLLTILDNIVSVSKMDSGMIKPHFETIDVDQVLSDTREMFHLLARQAGLEFKYKKSQTNEPVKMVSDPVMLQQILNNLVSNAIKYTPEGSITIGCDKMDTKIEFFVADTGLGIPEHEREAIFKPFRQVDRAYSLYAGGAGLGLAISKKMVAVLGGE
ncbi:MAG: HAMP domain-containing protein, partial [Marinilabiliaceae bacterium]|nr:HAMP domain-containing protein [Marinilabiliaceae bacterium]